MATGTRENRQGPSTGASQQREVLAESGARKPFVESLAECGLCPLRATGIEVLQVSLGRRCNQACRHCHVDAGPDRTEIMSRQTMQSCLDVLAKTAIATLDITGGAPEMHPDFRWFVEQSRRLDRRVIDRCNLTILTEPGFQDMPEFLAGQQLEIVASLPCYLRANVDAQRGEGVMERSIRALRRLNSLGYGHPGSNLILNLVFNPAGTLLPPPQATLQQDYRRELRVRYGIVFNRLFTITNMPINRFLGEILGAGQYESYMEKLVAGFNLAAAERVMCRSTLSVDWTGRLFDCDFNQALDLGIGAPAPKHIDDFNETQLGARDIAVGNHCYGCTAGAGSSCRGETVPGSE